MKHTTYFQIEPSAQEADILLQPVLTSKSWADRSAWRQEAVAIAVKPLYLARIREYEFVSSPSDARRVLGSDAIAIEVFDRWWTLREMPWVEPSEHWEDYLAAVPEHVEVTGDIAVDDMVRAILMRQTSARPS